MARPRKTIDYDVFSELCEIQCTGEECAAVLGINYDTLNRILKRDGHKCFTEYFKQYAGKGKTSLRRKQFKVAEDGNATMLIWLGKQYLGQSDKIEQADTSEAVNKKYL